MVTEPTGGFTRSAASGVAWTTAQKWFGRITGLLTVAILARLLDPTDFGLVAVAMSIIPFVYLLSDLGFSSYLVQAENVSRRTLSTAFWYASVAGCVLGVALWFSGPLIELVLGVEGVAGVMRGLAPAVVFVALGAIPSVLLRRKLQFRALALLNFIAGFLGQVVAVSLALTGFGVWALIGQTVVTQFFAMVLVWVATRWLPGWTFSWSEFITMFRYGLSVISVELIALTRFLAENAIIAATLGVAGLGYLNIAQRLIQVAQDLTASAITPVSTVVFAQIRARVDRLASGYTRAQAMVYAIIVPAMVFVVVGAPQLVPLIFGTQWGVSIQPAQALAVAGILTVGAALDQALFYGLGKPGIWLAYAFAIDALTVVVTLVLARFGLLAVAVGFVGVGLVATWTRWPLVARRLEISWWHLALPFTRAIALGAVLAAAGGVVGALSAGLPSVIALLFIGLTISLVWLALVRPFLPETASELMQMARRLVKKLRRRPHVPGESSAESEGH